MNSNKNFLMKKKILSKFKICFKLVNSHKNKMKIFSLSTNKILINRYKKIKTT